jgi:uncharacterized protein YeaO (DUF488 family)
MKTRVPAKSVKLKRAYEKPAAADGTRVLVDRLWPRGIKTLGELRTLARGGSVTLIYAARDQDHNEAVIIRDMLVG